MTALNLTCTPEEFRENLNDWLEAHAPKSLWNTVSTPFHGHWGGRNTEFQSPDHKAWFETCLPLGMTAPGWPAVHGGAGLPSDHVRVWREELRRRQIPLPLVGVGLTMIGPILLAEGNAEQQAEHIPKIIRGEIRWAQGYSEPNAGSDLASLRTKATEDGDDYIIEGQKVWTSHADVSDWIFCLVRTSTEGKKQAGITFLIFDMKSPGITIRPIQLISGASPFCEVFFDKVRVPKSHVVGQVNDGWKVAKALLAHERTMVGESIAGGGARPTELQEYTLRAHASQTIGLNSTGQLADPLLRDEIVRSEMEQRNMGLLIEQINEVISTGGHPGPESSILKIIGTELNQRRWELGARIAGPNGVGWEGEQFSEVERALARQWLRSRGNTIEGGSSEIQRNIVATRVLGLPRGK